MPATNQHIKTYIMLEQYCGIYAWCNTLMIKFTKVLHRERTMLDYDCEICITPYILITWLLFMLNDRWFFQTKHIMQDYDCEICVSLCKLITFK